MEKEFGMAKKKWKKWTSIALMTVAASAWAQYGKPPADFSPKLTNKERTAGLSGFVLATADADWMEKWKHGNGSDKKYTINQASGGPRGKNYTFLIIVMNPKLDEKDEAHIECDLVMKRPDGKVEIERKGETCLKGKASGGIVHMGALAIRFKGEPTDPLGKWSIDVAMRDKVGGQSKSAHADFELKPAP